MYSLGLYGRLARTLLRTKQFSEALDYAEKALEAFPTSAKLCFIQVGQALLLEAANSRCFKVFIVWPSLSFRFFVP